MSGPGSLFKGSSSSRGAGSLFKGGGSSSKAAGPKRKPHGVGGFFHNLAHDAAATVTGAGPAIAGLGKAALHDSEKLFYESTPGGQYQPIAHEKSQLKPIGKALVKPYVDARHPRRLAQDFYDNPLSTALAFTPVVGAAGKVLEGTRLATAGRTIELRSPAAALGDTAAPVAKRYVSPKPVHGHLQLAVDKVKKLAPYAPEETTSRAGNLFSRAVGEGARYGRHEASRSLVERKNLEAQATPHMQVIGHLRKHERVATFLRETLPDPASVHRYVDHLKSLREPAASKTAKILVQPDVMRLYHTPSKRMLAAHGAIDELRGQHGFVLGDLLDQETAAARPYLHEMLARGGRFEPTATPPSRLLTKARQRVVSLEARFEKAKGDRRTVPYPPVREAGQTITREVPRTAAQVDARLAELNKWIDKRVKVIYRDVFRADPEMRSSSISKDTRPRREMTDTDKFRGVIGGGRALEPPDRVFRAQHGPTKDWGRAEQALYKLGTKPDAHPMLREIAARMDERDHLNQLKGENVPAVFREPGTKAPGFGTTTETAVGTKDVPSDMPARVTKGGPGVDRIGGALSLAREELARLEERHAANEAKFGARGDLTYRGPSAEHVAADLKAQGLREPGYLPDSPSPGRKKGQSRYAGGGGLNPAKMPSELKQNHGVLFLTGQLAHDPRVLNEAFLRSVTFAHRNDLWNRGFAAGEQVPVSSLDRVPEGMVAMNQPVGARVGVKVAGKTQTVASGTKAAPKLWRTAADFDHWAADNLRGLQEGSTTENALFTHDLAKAHVEGGHVVLLPEVTARALTGEFRSQSTVINLLNRYPMRVWRTLVLGLRPAWLVNNVVGNTLMYLVHNSGAKGLGALASQFRVMIHPGSRGEFDALMQRHFGSQLSGTYVGTAGTIGVGRRIGQFQGLAKFDRAYEQTLRSAAVKAFLQKHPVVKARVTAMQAETHSFWHAAGHALDADPELARVIEQQVNDSLGNFSNLSRVEQSYIRAVFPFYAWYRAITAVVLKLPLTAPVKSALLGRLGRIQGEQNIEAQGYAPGEGPAWKAGYLPVGGVKNGRRPTIGFGGLNPYATVAQLVEAGRGLAVSNDPMEAGRALSLLAPEFGAGVAATSGKNPVTGRPYHSVPGGLLANIPVAIGENLPQSVLLESLLGRRPANASKSGRLRFTEHTRNADLLRYLGAPYNNIAVK